MERMYPVEMHMRLGLPMRDETARDDSGQQDVRASRAMKSELARRRALNRRLKRSVRDRVVRHSPGHRLLGKALC